MPKLKGSSTVRRASGRAPRPVSPPLYPPESKEVAPKSATLPLTYEQSRLSAQQRGAVVIGVDEAGRGPLAGPVVAAACAILDPSGNPPVLGVDDSKKVDEEERERLYEELVRHPGLVFGVATVDHAVIDEINILQATFRGMQDATANLVAKLPSSAAIAHVAVDGPHVPPGLRSSYGPVAAGVIGGDARVYSIAAASIVAKVTRDRLMREHDRAYPAYGFAKHKGYGVAAHVEAIRKHGPCPIHRRTFAPVKNWFPVGPGAALAAAAAADVSAAAGAAPPRKARAPPRDRSAAAPSRKRVSRAAPPEAAPQQADSGKGTRSRAVRKGAAAPPAAPAQDASLDRKRKRAQK